MNFFYGVISGKALNQSVEEDHFYLFVYTWFLIEKTRQVSTNIRFLQGIRIKNL